MRVWDTNSLKLCSSDGDTFHSEIAEHSKY